MRINTLRVMTLLSANVYSQRWRQGRVALVRRLWSMNGACYKWNMNLLMDQQCTTINVRVQPIHMLQSCQTAQTLNCMQPYETQEVLMRNVKTNIAVYRAKQRHNIILPELKCVIYSIQDWCEIDIVMAISSRLCIHTIVLALLDQWSPFDGVISDLFIVMKDSRSNDLHWALNW
jgi:hypothetical protein